MKRLKTALFTIGLMLAPAVAIAQAPVASAPAPAQVVAPVTPVAASPAPSAKAEAAPAAAVAETTIGTSKPDPAIGQPIFEKIGLQPQVTKLGQQAANMHDHILVPMMVIISLFVLGLMFWVSARYRRAANPVASKTSHNTFIEIVWTLVPVIILVGIAIPSISLLAAQYEPSPKNAITLKAIGNQWFWEHEYPDYGVKVSSNILSDADDAARGEPKLLGVDNRVVLPVNTPIKLLTTANDVIHAWAIPAFWIKMDAVPGRINETSFTVEKTGVYYGQCSELCGIKHGYMPIAVEVVSEQDFKTWIKAKGGKLPEAEPAEPVAPAASAAPAVAAPAPVKK